MRLSPFVPSTEHRRSPAIEPCLPRRAKPLTRASSALLSSRSKPHLMASISLEDRLRKLPCWRGRVELEPLKGGISNTSFTVTDLEGRFVARCGGDIAVHHVFRDRERAASEAAFRAGLSPELVYAEPGLMVFRYIDGRTFSEADMRANVERIVPLLHLCHRTVGRFLTGPPSMFWVFHVIRDYAATLGKAQARAADELA